MSQNINLFNPKLLQRDDRLNAKSLLMASGIFILALISLAIWIQFNLQELEQEIKSASLRAKQEEDKLVAATRAINEYKPDVKIIADLTRAERLLQARNELVELVTNGSLGDTQGFSEQMRAFARQTLEGLWLTGFTIQGEGGAMQIDGQALKAELLPVYIHRLNTEKVFQGQRFSALDIKKLPEQEQAAASLQAKRNSTKAQHATTIAFSMSAKAQGAESARQ